MKIVVTFSGLDPTRLAEHVERRLREDRATRLPVTMPRTRDDAAPPSSPPFRPARWRLRRDRRS
jgi:hypothetical protein